MSHNLRTLRKNLKRKELDLVIEEIRDHRNQLWRDYMVLPNISIKGATLKAVIDYIDHELLGDLK